MATYYVVNPVRVGSDSVLWPGTPINSLCDNVPRIQSAGGKLVATGNATIDAAAKQAQDIKARGGSMEEASSIMVAAVASV